MPQTVKRQPLSCENCRKRKIKCSGERPYCGTCEHRGYSTTCFYLRQNVQTPPSSTSDEVLQRLERIENLLERQSRLLDHRYDPVHETRSPTQDFHSQRQPLSLKSSPWAESDASQFDSTEPYPVGSVLRYGNGYERFVPGIASADADAVNELIQPTSAPSVSTNFPFTDESVTSRQALLESLPPFRQCDELKDIFFEVFSPLFHILHDPTFHAEYASFRRNPGEVPLSFLALVFVVLSISVNAVDTEHPLLADLGLEASASANIKSLAAKYRSAAMKCLSADQFMWRHNLHTVQALVLLIYAISHASGPAWALLGTTFHICVSLGCHIDPTQLNLNPVEVEQRRRVWAGLMLLYTIQNTALGNLAPVKLTAAATVQPPADLDDEDIRFEGTVQRYAHGCTQRPPTKMSYILLKFKLYTLASDICNFARTRGDWNSLLELENRISEEEHEHETRFADGQQLPIYHHAHRYILNNYVHYMRLILYRPYLQSLSHTSSRGSSYSPEQIQQNRARCRTAAFDLLSNHEELCGNPSYRPYLWFVYGLGSLQAFLAASTLVVLAKNDDMSATYRPQILHVLQKCLACFESMASRSDMSSKAALILRRLLRRPRTDSRNLEPPPLLHHTSSPSEESDMGSTLDGQSAFGHGLPMVQHDPMAFAYQGDVGKMDTSWFNCPPQMYELFSLPPEQWFGGASSLAWDWTGWLDTGDSQMNAPQPLIP